MTKPTTEAYGQIQQAYDHFNASLFAGALPECVLTFSRRAKTLGYFSPARFRSTGGDGADEIAINPVKLDEREIEDALAPLVHQMAHLYIEHHGKSSNTGYHSKEWAAKMKEIGLQPSETGLPGGDEIGEKMSQYVIDGGSFQLACKELTETGFALSWAATSEEDPIDSLSSLADIGVNREAALSIDTEDKEAVAAAIGATDASAPEVEAAIDLIEKAQKAAKAAETREKKKKLAYVCPSCQSKVWGKPELNIACGDCNEAFEIEAEGVEA